MSAAIYFHPEGYSTRGPKLMGRHAAGESFLKGFLLHATQSKWWAYVEDLRHARILAEEVKRLGRGDSVVAIDRQAVSRLAEPGAMFLPGPRLGSYAFERALFNPAGWSLCGITHTTSSANAMDSIVEWLTAPIEPWDAVICTSNAVKAQVTDLLQGEADRLSHRLGITRLRLPQLPMIPLGVHTADFLQTPTARHAARQAWGIDDQTMVVLYLGRLSFHAKAHPLAMYQSLQAAAEQTGRSVLLLEVGWHANDAVAQAYAQAAQEACPLVKVLTLDGRDPSIRQQAWAGSDVFCSLSDNIQETFGITPLEAMAAGLPVVVTDWDGYKDTVRHGVDGFRIPTVMPHAGLGGDLAARHALGVDNYDYYCGHTCAFVGVDVHAAAQAFARLFESPSLRQSMGQAGQARARGHYDWAVIIPQYEGLWADLTGRRRAEGPTALSASTGSPASPWPARADPYKSFKGYPTNQLQPTTLLRLVDDNAHLAIDRFRRLRQLRMVDFARQVLPTDAELEQALARLAHGVTSAQAVVQDLDPARQAIVFRGLTFLIKLNLVVWQYDPTTS